MTTPLILPNFDKSTFGLSLPSNGWTIFDQGIGATSSVDKFPGTNRKCGRLTTTNGLWSAAVRPGTIANMDYRIRVSSNNNNGIYVMVRNQSSFFFDPSYCVLLSNDSNTVAIYKLCGGNAFNLASFAKSFSLADVRVRIVMVGLVMNVYVNGDYVGDYDFTGNALCSNAAFTTGGYGVLGFNQTMRFMPDYPQPSVGFIK